MKIAKRLQGKISELRKRSDLIWFKALTHSQNYQRALKLNDYDLEWLQKDQAMPDSMRPSLKELARCGFLKVNVACEDFVFIIKDICGAYYGIEGPNSWQKLIIAICTTHQELNNQSGAGTSLINIVQEELHEQLLKTIEEDDGEDCEMLSRDDL